MVFTWQAPMMLMAYAVTSFMGGLLVYVCTPLFNGEFGAPEFKVGPSKIQSSVFEAVIRARAEARPIDSHLLPCDRRRHRGDFHLLLLLCLPLH